MNNKFTHHSENRDNNILYRISKAIDIADIKSNYIQRLIEDMYKKMKGMGIGLAANQIGESIQLFMIEFKKDTEKYKSVRAK